MLRLFGERRIRQSLNPKNNANFGECRICEAFWVDAPNLGSMRQCFANSNFGLDFFAIRHNFVASTQKIAEFGRFAKLKLIQNWKDKNHILLFVFRIFLVDQSLRTKMVIPVDKTFTTFLLFRFLRKFNWAEKKRISRRPFGEFRPKIVF